MRYGETIPKGLRPIENDEIMEFMWCDAILSDRPLMVDVYMQDCDWDNGIDDGDDNYELPEVVPPHQVADELLSTALVESLWDMDEREGEAEVERKQYRCERWYVSAIQYPRGRVDMFLP